MASLNFKPLQRLAGRHAGRWVAQHDEVWRISEGAERQNERICWCGSADTASYIALMHAVVLPLINAYLLLKRRLNDLKTEDE